MCTDVDRQCGCELIYRGECRELKASCQLETGRLRGR